MKKEKERGSFSEADSNGVFREAYGYFEKRTMDFQMNANSNDEWKKFCNSEIPENICAIDEHDFARFDEITGGIIYKCKKCGIKAVDPVLSGEFYKAFLGSFIDSRSFVWHHDRMDVGKIAKISLSFGDYPIINIIYERNKITYKNSINGSRDGWMSHPKGFFDKHTLRLKKEQTEALKNALNDANIDTWITDPHIFSNIGACGFCLHTTFECVFENGSAFVCYSPNRFDGFSAITNLLSEICGFSAAVSNVKDNEGFVPGLKKIKAIRTGCCNITIPKGQSYCPKCGQKIEDKESYLYFDMDYDPDQTSWICECLSTNACEHLYCSNCGKKRPF